MLERLKLRDVGPADEMQLELAPRLNIITGDNGLGKSFLLDVAWWALTGAWAEKPAMPRRHRGATPTIDVAFGGIGRAHRFHFRRQAWLVSRAGASDIDESITNGLEILGEPESGLVLYARVDGGVCVFDSARNQRGDQRESGAPLEPPYLFSREAIWDGLPLDSPKKRCNGLIADWANWQRERGEAFSQFVRVLEGLAPSAEEPLVPGALTRVSLDDVRDIPTLALPYGEVPITHASAGMRRILALAYLLVWAWREHLRACELSQREPSSTLVLLIDELGAHLHPRWQRVILRSLLAVVDELTGDHRLSVQIVGATHSPMVLASLDPIFDPVRDRLWSLDLVDTRVILTLEPWRRRGDANAWLTSPSLDLAQPRSVEAEQAIARADALGKADSVSKQELAEAEAQLRAALGDTDPYWMGWRFFRERQRQRTP
ncbi:MAG: AAA family ATPase [Enhygromyxa sp.]